MLTRTANFVTDSGIFTLSRVATNHKDHLELFILRQRIYTLIDGLTIRLTVKLFVCR